MGCDALIACRWSTAWVVVLVCGLADVRAQPTVNAERPPPALTSAEQVHRLTRAEAQQWHPVLIRGVVICPLPEFNAAVIQDSTRGIYVSYVTAALGEVPRIGDLLEVAGITDPGEFAPNVVARRVTRLGAGQLPQPVRPTWDQLCNGSLDTQYVEIPGVVTAIQSNGVTLLTHGGKIKAALPGLQLQMKHWENSLIRLRGCLFASWDAATHRVRVGEIRVFAASVIVDEPAAEDVFAIPQKRAGELLLFDAQASALRRVKVSGQVTHGRENEYFMMDGANGLRFIPKEPLALRVGDFVEVVGFPNLNGPSPVLQEATARPTHWSALGEPKKLHAENLFLGEHDATLVQIEATLVNLNTSQAGQMLELQSGLRRFVARMDARDGFMKSIPAGSRLLLTGAYAGRGGNRAASREVDSFELLLNAPTNVAVLSRPSWWTLRRLMVVVGALIGVLCGAVVWIRLLHHKVQVRTAQLQKEIAEREHAEHQRALAQERARIARDLHDDLGSSLTEITMLATTGPGLKMPSDEASERLGTIAGKSRTMVNALDEIVWAVDPQRDTLASVARYLASYAEEYLAGLNVACRVQIPNSFPGQVVPGEVRHHLFLAVKEALNNAVRHGVASEIVFRVFLSEDRMHISISDNGSGFDLSGRLNGNGLFNLRNRLEKLGGHCELDSSPGTGTAVTLQLPLPVSNNQS